MISIAYSAGLFGIDVVPSPVGEGGPRCGG